MTKAKRQPAAKNPKRENSTLQRETSLLESKYFPVILAVIVFAFGLGNQMTGVDDHAATVENQAVTGPIENLFGNFNLGMYAPVTWIFYKIAWLLGKDGGFWYHLMSLVVHAVNTALVFKLMRRLTLRDGVAATVALLFAIHPIQVESVAWIAGFSTPAYALFSLLAIHRYLDYSERETTDFKAYGLALLFFILAALAKSAAVVIAPLLVLLDEWRRSPIEKKRLYLGYVPFFLAALGFGLLTIYSRTHSNMAIGGDNGFSTFERALLIVFTPVFYWFKLIFPLKLNIYYSFDKVNGALPWYYYAAPFVLATALWAAWHWRKTAPWIYRGLLFFFINIAVTLPVVSLGTFELCADHYNYLASIGIFYLLTELWITLQYRYANMTAALKGFAWLWVGLLIILSVRQVRIWKDTVTVISNAIDNGYYQQGMMYFARGVEYGDLGKFDLALQDFNRTIELNPDHYDAHKFRGSLYAQSKDFKKAIPDLMKYLEHDKKDGVSWFNMGMIYMEMGEPAKAVDAFTQSLEAKPNIRMTLEQRALAWERLGNTQKAAEDRALIKQIGR